MYEYESMGDQSGLALDDAHADVPGGYSLRTKVEIRVKSRGMYSIIACKCMDMYCHHVF